MGHDGPAAIGQPRRHDRQLQRRGEDKALADAGDKGLAQDPWLTDYRPLPVLGRDDAGAFARNIDIKLRRQSQPLRHRRNAVDSDAPGDFVEINVTGLTNAA